jgi:hypothetical protein
MVMSSVGARAATVALLVQGAQRDVYKNYNSVFFLI